MKGVGGGKTNGEEALRAWWKNRGEAAREAHVLHKGDPELGSWLFARVHDGTGFALGCKACHLARRKTEFGEIQLASVRQVKNERLRKHEDSLEHQQAVATLVGDSLQQGDVDDAIASRAAPPARAFREVWDARCKPGRTPDIPGIGGRFKVKRMMYCLYEAIVMNDRELIRQAECMATHSDGRAKRLSIRFAVNGPSLLPHRGHLGHVDYVEHKRSGAESATAIGRAYDGVIRNFCTFGKHAPDSDNEVFDEALYDHMRRIHEVFDSDAERCMINCGLDLAGALLPRDQRGQAYFYNNKVLVKDPTHAARRVLERPWKAHPALHEVVCTLTTERHSIMKRIKNSDIFKATFAAFVVLVPDAPFDTANAGIQNLSSADHRFDSVVFPMTRGVLLFDALVATALHISTHRPYEEEGRDANGFLTYISGEAGEFRLILYAMLADGMAAIIVFVRYWDTEAHDIAAISEQIGILANTLDWLFGGIRHTRRL